MIKLLFYAYMLLNNVTSLYDFSTVLDQVSKNKSFWVPLWYIKIPNRFIEMFFETSLMICASLRSHSPSFTSNHKSSSFYSTIIKSKMNCDVFFFKINHSCTFGSRKFYYVPEKKDSSFNVSASIHMSCIISCSCGPMGLSVCTGLD